MTALTIPEAALTVLTDRLATALPDLPVQRDRRGPVDTDKETLPLLVAAMEGLDADTSQEPGMTHYRVVLSVTGYAKGDEDTGAARAVHELWGRVVTVLAGWTPAQPGLGDVAEQSAEFTLFDTEESANPAGFFIAGFNLLVIAPTGHPTVNI